MVRLSPKLRKKRLKYWHRQKKRGRQLFNLYRRMDKALSGNINRQSDRFKDRWLWSGRDEEVWRKMKEYPDGLSLIDIALLYGNNHRHRNNKERVRKLKHFGMIYETSERGHVIHKTIGFSRPATVHRYVAYGDEAHMHRFSLILMGKVRRVDVITVSLPEMRALECREFFEKELNDPISSDILLALTNKGLLFNNFKPYHRKLRKLFPEDVKLYFAPITEHLAKCNPDKGDLWPQLKRRLSNDEDLGAFIPALRDNNETVFLMWWCYRARYWFSKIKTPELRRNVLPEEWILKNDDEKEALWLYVMKPTGTKATVAKAIRHYSSMFGEAHIAARDMTADEEFII